jgi:hypothetical protein
MDQTRRRSPSWVREMSSQELHAIAGRFNRQRPMADLTERQEWFYDAIVSELEYRRRRARPTWSACACYLCLSPFPGPLLSDEDGGAE